MVLIDKPQLYQRSIYNEAIEKICERLSAKPEICSLYQVGSISDPGISDIDLIVVFHDDTGFYDDPRNYLNKDHRYLFIHPLYGINKSDWKQMLRFSFLHNRTLLFGETLSTDRGLTEPEEAAIKKQIAMEYLIKMWIMVEIQKTYKIVKARALLLEAKAVRYDIDFLDIDGSGIIKETDKIIEIRKQWFTNPNSMKLLQEWFIGFAEELNNLISVVFHTRRLYLPRAQPYQMRRNIHIDDHSHAGISRSGLVLFPYVAKVLGKRYFNLLHRFNRFQVQLPTTTEPNTAICERRWQWQQTAGHYAQHRFPELQPVGGPLL